MEMDVEEHEDQTQDMSSEDENKDCEAVMKSKTFNNFVYLNQSGSCLRGWN